MAYGEKTSRWDALTLFIAFNGSRLAKNEKVYSLDAPAINL